MKKLKLYLKQEGEIVLMRVLLQEGINQGILTEHIALLTCPQLDTKRIYLRGEDYDQDDKTVCKVLPSVQEATEYLNKVIEWLDEIFYTQDTLKRGDIVYVRDDECQQYVERIFLTKIEGAVLPYVVVSPGYAENFKTGKPFFTINYKYIKKQLGSGYCKETSSYYGECK